MNLVVQKVLKRRQCLNARTLAGTLRTNSSCMQLAGHGILRNQTQCYGFCHAFGMSRRHLRDTLIAEHSPKAIHKYFGAGLRLAYLRRHVLSCCVASIRTIPTAKESVTGLLLFDVSTLNWIVVVEIR